MKTTVDIIKDGSPQIVSYQTMMENPGIYRWRDNIQGNEYYIVKNNKEVIQVYDNNVFVPDTKNLIGLWFVKANVKINLSFEN